MRNFMMALAILSLVACGAAGGGGGRSGKSDDESGHGGSGGGGAGPAAGDDNADPGAPPEEPFIPEEEEVVNLQVPQGGERFVYVVSEGLDAVVRIDAVTLVVDLIEVGGGPTLMQTLGGEDSLVVINSGTRDFSVVRSNEDGAEPDVKTLDSPVVVNRLEASVDGMWAIAWYDPDQPGEVGDLQQVLVLNLTPGAEAVYPVGVGFHPLTVTFETGGSFVYVVTEDGVSAIDMASLKGPSFVPTVSVTEDPTEPWFDREVLITPDGTRAVVRRGGINELRLIDLDTGDSETLALDGPPTDVDLTLAGDEALIVIRDTAQLVRAKLDAFSEPEIVDLTGTPAGLATLTPDGERAILYSSLAGNEWLAVLTLETGAIWKYVLKKDIRAVTASPDGQTLLVVHDKLDEAATPEDTLDDTIDKSEGYSIVDVMSGYAKLELLPTAPGLVTITPDSAQAYVLIADDAGASHGVDAIDLETLLVTAIPMGSPPTHAVYVPAAERVAVNQEHPVGRITFISTGDGATETVTGFELNGLIE